MLDFDSGTKVYLACGTTDLRKDFDDRHPSMFHRLGFDLIDFELIGLENL